MFTYIFIYLMLYITTYFLLLGYLSTVYNFKGIESLYLNTILNYLKKYTLLSPVWFLLFTLTGLPPVGFFLIKFNILLTVFNNLNSLFQLLIFINILLTMFFYLQIFNTVNINTKLNIKSLKLNTLKKKSTLNFTTNVFSFYLYCTIFLFINILFIYYFADIYLILFNNFL